MNLEPKLSLKAKAYYYYCILEMQLINCNEKMQSRNYILVFLHKSFFQLVLKVFDVAFSRFTHEIGLPFSYKTY